jgi:PmbA protein
MIEKSLKWLSEKVDEAEIFKLELKGANILTKKTDIDTFKEKRSTGYGIRVIKDKRMGFYFSNTLSTQTLEKAVEVSKLAQEDQNVSLPEKQTFRRSPLSSINLEVEEAIKMAKELISASREFREINPTSGSISWSTALVTIANTNGVFGEKSEFTISAYLGTVAKVKEPASGFHFEVSRKKDINALEVGTAACRLAKDSLRPKGLETKERRVILRPMAVTELLEYTLIPSFSADNVQRERSRLKGMVGQGLFHNISMVDDGTLKDGLMSEDFDDEGVAAKRKELVKDGLLLGFLYDTYTANKAGKESTGNGARTSYSTLPSVGPSNFIISGPDIIDKEEGALVVHGLVGAHTSNPTSGDFSCETRNAFLDGVPIKKAIVSGNIFDILRDGVRFGKDQKQYSSVFSPSIELPEVMVVG